MASTKVSLSIYLGLVVTFGVSVYFVSGVVNNQTIKETSQVIDKAVPVVSSLTNKTDFIKAYDEEAKIQFLSSHEGGKFAFSNATLANSALVKNATIDELTGIATFFSGGLDAKNSKYIFGVTYILDDVASAPINCTLKVNESTNASIFPTDGNIGYEYAPEHAFTFSLNDVKNSTNPSPIPSATWDDVYIPADSSLTTSNLVGGKPFINENGTATLFFKNLFPGTYKFKLAATKKNFAKAERTYSLTVIPAPVSITPTNAISSLIYGDSHTISFSASVPGGTWSLGENTNCSQYLTPVKVGSVYQVQIGNTIPVNTYPNVYKIAAQYHSPNGYADPQPQVISFNVNHAQVTIIPDGNNPAIVEKEKVASRQYYATVNGEKISGGKWSMSPSFPTAIINQDTGLITFSPGINTTVYNYTVYFEKANYQPIQAQINGYEDSISVDKIAVTLLSSDGSDVTQKYFGIVNSKRYIASHPGGTWSIVSADHASIALTDAANGIITFGSDIPIGENYGYKLKYEIPGNLYYSATIEGKLNVVINTIGSIVVDGVDADGIFDFDYGQIQPIRFIGANILNGNWSITSSDGKVADPNTYFEQATRTLTLPNALSAGTYSFVVECARTGYVTATLSIQVNIHELVSGATIETTSDLFVKPYAQAHSELLTITPSDDVPLNFLNPEWSIVSVSLGNEIVADYSNAVSISAVDELHAKLDFTSFGFTVQEGGNYTIVVQFVSENYLTIYKTCYLQVAPHVITTITADEAVAVTGGKTIQHSINGLTSTQLAELGNLTWTVFAHNLWTNFTIDNTGKLFVPRAYPIVPETYYYKLKVTGKNYTQYIDSELRFCSFDRVEGWNPVITASPLNNNTIFEFTDPNLANLFSPTIVHEYSYSSVALGYFQLIFIDPNLANFIRLEDQYIGRVTIDRNVPDGAQYVLAYRFFDEGLNWWFTERITLHKVVYEGTTTEFIGTDTTVPYSESVEEIIYPHAFKIADQTINQAFFVGETNPNDFYEYRVVNLDDPTATQFLAIDQDGNVTVDYPQMLEDEVYSLNYQVQIVFKSVSPQVVKTANFNTKFVFENLFKLDQVHHPGAENEIVLDDPSIIDSTYPSSIFYSFPNIIDPNSYNISITAYNAYNQAVTSYYSYTINRENNRIRFWELSSAGNGIVKWIITFSINLNYNYPISNTITVYLPVSGGVSTN